jgi:hypothetical protein
MMPTRSRENNKRLQEMGAIGDTNLIIAWLPVRKPSRQYVFEKASEETLSVMKEVMVKQTRVERGTNWVFFTTMTDEFILGPDV